jgi:F1F0 ATPase subunit 2
MIINAAALGISFCAGLAIGALYFLGLWWTVRRLPALKAPALWVLVSFLLRSAVAVAGFYFVMQGRWQNLLICVAGFTLMRLWLVRRITPAAVQIRSG